jgi:methionine-rich copper-binding protein CopC
MRNVERLWGRLNDLFAPRSDAKLATQLVLAPRQLERRRLLDAGAAGLALELLDSQEFVQAGPDFTQIGASQADAQSEAQSPPLAAMSNTPPSNIQFAAIADVHENGIATLQLTFNDPDIDPDTGGDTHTVEIDWGDGSPLQTLNVPTGSQLFSTTHQHLDDNPTGTPLDSYTISVRVIDSVGDDATASTTVTVNNVAPSNLQITPPSAINENGVGTLQLSFDDPGTQDVHKVDIDWGDGSAVETVTLSGGARLLTRTHQYGDDNPTGTSSDVYTISVTVRDDDGGSVSGRTGVTVNNVPPTALFFVASPAAQENGVAAMLIVFDDPGLQDTHTVEIDWGDGSAIETLPVTPGLQFLTATHQYLDDNPTGTPADNYTIKLRVLDDDGGVSATSSSSITVSNVAPSNLHLEPVATVNENDLAMLNLTFNDDGTQDVHTVEIDWGDGSAVETITLATGVRALSTTHQYLDDNPTATSSDNYTVKVRVLDDDGGATAFATTNVQVNNVTPSGVTIAPLGTINENDVATLQLTFNDPGTQDQHTVEVDWGDGSAVETLTVAAGARTFSTTHLYRDDNPTGTPSDNYAVSVRVLDDDGGASAATTAQITVNNVAPSNVVVAPLGTINENDVATLNLTFDDPGPDDTHTVEIDWGDGSAVQTLTVAAGTRSFSTTHQYLDDNPTGTPSDNYTVSVRMLDDDGGASAVTTAQITVNNVAPSNVVVAPLGTINENDVATLNLAFDDPGTLDAHTVEIDWGDGSPLQTLTVAAGTRSFSTTHLYLDDNPTATSSDNYTVSVRVLDDDGGASTAATAQITVNNVEPSNVVVAPLGTINENDVATLNLTFDDPGTLDSHTVEIDWGDGSTLETVTVVAGARSFTTTHQYLDDNPTATSSDVYTVSMRVLDDDGGASAARTAPITVNNVAPLNVAVAPPGSAVNEGSQITLDFTFDDPGSLDTHTYEVDWGDGVITTGVVAGRAFIGSHTYADNGEYTVRVKVTDDDGGVGMGVGSVTVDNVAPTLSVAANQTINEGSQLTLTNIGTFTDPGFNNPLNSLDPANGGEVDETFTFEVEWGDGTAPDIGFATVDALGRVGVPTAGSFDGSHTFADNGTYTVTVTVTDDDFGVTQRTFTVTVLNVDPSLTGETPSPTVLEGQSFTLTSLGVGIQDPGFDNPLNAGNAANGGETEETFTGVTVDWGDGTTPDALETTDRVSGSPGVVTTADFAHAPHTYADNGTYTVTILLSDDDGGVVSRTLTIVVQNAAPTLTLTTEQLTINEGDTLNIPGLGTFTDPGFDNPLNAGNSANGGETEETFSYTIDWGDGSELEEFDESTTRTPGGAGVPTSGTLVGSHRYLDNDVDNKYTITVTLTDDDGGVAVKSFEITVLNVNPTLQPVTATNVNAQGQTTLVLEFSDPGADSYEVLVDWGDRLDFPPDERFVVETLHAGPTPQTFALTHTYDGPPDPLNPANDIKISVKVRDDDFGTGALAAGESNLEFDVITNPGEGNKFIRIDTSPKVPIITLSVRPVNTTVVTAARTEVDASDGAEITGAAGESLVSSERYFELRIVDRDGNDVPIFGADGEMTTGYRLPANVLEDLPGLFRKLPDNTYRIYLVQGETDVERLVIEVVVRNGRMIDPGDDSEGARDKPPTDESAPAAEVPAQGAVGDEIDQAIDDATGDVSDADVAPTYRPATAAVLRHGSTLAGVALALSSAGRAWRTQVDEALAKAERDKRRRLRTAGHWRRKRAR